MVLHPGVSLGAKEGVMLKQVCSSAGDGIHPGEKQDLKAPYVEEPFSTHLLSQTTGPLTKAQLCSR